MLAALRGCRRSVRHVRLRKDWDGKKEEGSRARGKSSRESQDQQKNSEILASLSEIGAGSGS